MCEQVHADRVRLCILLLATSKTPEPTSPRGRLLLVFYLADGFWPPTGANLRSPTGPTSNLPLRRPQRLGVTNGSFRRVGC